MIGRGNAQAGVRVTAGCHRAAACCFFSRPFVGHVRWRRGQSHLKTDERRASVHQNFDCALKVPWARPQNGRLKSGTPLRVSSEETSFTKHNRFLRMTFGAHSHQSVAVSAVIDAKGKSGRWDSNPRRQPWEGCILPLNYARSSASLLASTSIDPAKSCPEFYPVPISRAKTEV